MRVDRDAGDSKLWPRITLAVLRPTPGSVTRSSMRAGNLAAEAIDHRLGHPDQAAGLARKNPVA